MDEINYEIREEVVMEREEGDGDEQEMEVMLEMKGEFGGEGDGKGILEGAEADSVIEATILANSGERMDQEI